MVRQFHYELSLIVVVVRNNHEKMFGLIIVAFIVI